MPKSKQVAIQYGASGFRTAITGAAIVGNYALSGLSKIPGVGGLIGDARFRSTAASKFFAPDSVDQFLSDYSESYELPDPTLTASIADKFTACFDARVHQVGQLTKVKASGDKLLLAMLADSTSVAEATIVRDRLNTALTPSDTDDLVNIKENLNAIKLWVKDPNTTYQPAVLAAYLEELNANGIKALEAQLKLDEEHITQLFTDVTFIKNLKTILKLPIAAPVASLDQVKEEMLNAIRDAHAKAIEPFKKDVPDILKKINDAAERASDNLLILAMIYEKGSAENRAKIEQLRQSAPMTVGQGKQKNKFKGVDITKLESFQTMSGLTLTHNQGSNSFSLNIPRGFYPYHQNPTNHIVADMMTIAKLIRAQIPKHEKLVIKIGPQSGDPKWRLDIARKAYEAGRLAGWPESGIEIQVYDKEGKTVEMGAIFGHHAQAKQNIEKKASDWETQRKQTKDSTVNFSLGEMKNTIQNVRKTEEDKKTAAAATPAPVPGRR